tara:strand:- start:68 stop:577 length:510 start_codon:yes stop_codon:yes gene_type:complete
VAEDSKNWWSKMVETVQAGLMVLIIYFLWVTGGEGLRSVELVVLLIILAILVIKFMIVTLREEMKEAELLAKGKEKTIDVEWITDKQVFTYFLIIPIVLFTIVYVYDYVDYNTALGVRTLGICASLLTIGIVLFALYNNETMIEAAAHAWLMLTVVGAILAIIVYLVIF